MRTGCERRDSCLDSLEIASSSSRYSRRHRVRSLAGARAIGVASYTTLSNSCRPQPLRHVPSLKTLNWCPQPILMREVESKGSS